MAGNAGIILVYVSGRPIVAPDNLALGLSSYQVFTVTHPFHPWHGRQFDVFSIRQNWGQWCVMFFADDPHLRSLPLGWTSLAPVDPFVTLAAGRTRFRLDDLLWLVQLCAALADPVDRPPHG